MNRAPEVFFGIAAFPCYLTGVSVTTVLRPPFPRPNMLRSRACQARFHLLIDFSPIRANGHVFDETQLFPDAAEDMLQLKTEFRQHFYNISRIMDCVGCDKCKLWGKIQTQGMGTALKILFSGDIYERSADNVIRRKPDFQLRRTDIVSLFHAVGKYVLLVSLLCLRYVLKSHSLYAAFT
ncbi:unnamed protein product [Dibothriocephalus latus]|uniref:Uncharacterized protein n=1 Tax=Dibothriocephalus latus TaxID=60516 RepID=A0A3P7LGN0_DIBLA|nr:unnamed protein product [Dibothriocephalus latus]